MYIYIFLEKKCYTIINIILTIWCCRLVKNILTVSIMWKESKDICWPIDCSFLYPPCQYVEGIYISQLKLSNKYGSIPIRNKVVPQAGQVKNK